MTLIHKERGGGWIGWMGLWWQGTWPFASFEIYDDRMKMRLAIFGVSKEVEMRPWDIEKIERRTVFPLLADGIYIKLRNSKLPWSLVFWSFNAEKLYSLVEDFKKQTVTV